jgi:hypothetical protein
LCQMKQDDACFCGIEWAVWDTSLWGFVER